MLGTVIYGSFGLRGCKFEGELLYDVREMQDKNMDAYRFKLQPPQAAAILFDKHYTVMNKNRFYQSKSLTYIFSMMVNKKLTETTVML